MEHVEECRHDPFAREVCTGMYEDRVAQISDLCEVLRAVYALTGEDKQIAALITPALARHEV